MKEMTIVDTKREVMIAYLMQKVEEQDWHGVMDAAADLREIDAQNRGYLLGGAAQRESDKNRAAQQASSTIKAQY